MSFHKIISISTSFFLFSFLFVAALSVANAATPMSSVTSSTTPILAPQMRLWGPQYANYYVGKVQKQAFWGPGYVFDQKSFWSWRYDSHNYRQDAEGHWFDKAAVDLDRLKK